MWLQTVGPVAQSLDEVLTADAELPLSGDLKGIVEAWLAHLIAERGQSAATREAYERDARQFLVFLKSHLGHPPCLGDLERLDARTIRAFLANRRKSGVASRSLARSLSALRTFFRWLEREDTLKNRAVLQVTAPKIPHSIPKPLTVQGAASLVERDASDAAEWITARDTAVMLLLYGAGLRISEALSLTPRTAPLDGRDIMHITGKGGKERLVPALAIVSDAIAKYIGLCPYPLEPDEPLFRGRPRRAAIAAPHSACNGEVARRTRFAGNGDAACASSLVCDAFTFGGSRFTANSGAFGSRLALDDPSLYGG